MYWIWSQTERSRNRRPIETVRVEENEALTGIGRSERLHSARGLQAL